MKNRFFCKKSKHLQYFHRNVLKNSDDFVSSVLVCIDILYYFNYIAS